MGLFSRTFQNPFELSKISASAFLIDSIINEAENNYLHSYQKWLEIAWICRVGIIDRIQKNNCQLTDKIAFQFEDGVRLITIQEICDLTTGRLVLKAMSFGIPQLSDEINNILDKGDVFYEVDENIDIEIKQQLEVPII